MMAKTLTALLLVFGVGMAATAQAQVVAPDRGHWPAPGITLPAEWSFVPDAAPWVDAPQEHRTPYRLTWRRDGLLFGAAGAGLLVANLVSSEHPDLSPEELAGFSRDAVIWFDRPATRRYSTDLVRLSEQVGAPLALAPLALLVDSRVRADWQSLTVMYVQTTMLSAAASGIAKETISRHRPNVYNAELSPEERTEREPGKSFFSSAATTAFARSVLLATVFSDHHPESRLRPYVWGAAIATAGTVGYLRYASGIHYPSDVLVGASVGSAIGYAVPRLHRADEESFSVGASAVHGGIGLSARFTF